MHCDLDSNSELDIAVRASVVPIAHNMAKAKPIVLIWNFSLQQQINDVVSMTYVKHKKFKKMPNHQNS